MGKQTLEVDSVLIDARKATKLAAWILGTGLTFVGSVAGGAWAVATWKAGVENHLQQTDQHMQEMDRKLDWIVTTMGRRDTKGISQ